MICLCVCAYFRVMGNESDGRRYKWLHCYKRSKNKIAIFPETAAFKLEKLARKDE